MEIIIDTSDLDRLAADMSKASEALDRELNDVAKNLARDGAKAMKAFSRQSNRKHGKRYTAGIRVDPGGGAGVFSYGPNAAAPQGGMSFEDGSRNQKPHLDGARSADMVSAVAEGRTSAAVEKVLRMLG